MPYRVTIKAETTEEDFTVEATSEESAIYQVSRIKPDAPLYLMSAVKI
jgi:hypothetical protein